MLRRARAGVGTSALIGCGLVSHAASAATPGTAVVHELLAQPNALRARLSQVSPEVGAARSRIAQAEADASTTRLIPNPIVDASAFPFRTRVEPAFATARFGASA